MFFLIELKINSLLFKKQFYYHNVSTLVETFLSLFYISEFIAFKSSLIIIVILSFAYDSNVYEVCITIISKTGTALPTAYMAYVIRYGLCNKIWLM